MSAWTFLSGGAVSLLSGQRLPTPGSDGPGAWVRAPAPLRPLLADELPGWIDEELWHVELSQSGDRARLLSRHDGWTPSAAAVFAEACAWRAREQAVRELRRTGHADAAFSLASLAQLTDVESWAREVQAETLPGHAALAADAACLADGRRPDSWQGDAGRRSRQAAAVIAANLAFVVAHTSGLEHAARAEQEANADAYRHGVASERAWQAAWLAERLDLGVRAA